MSIIKEEVALSYRVAGAQLQHGVYRFDKNAKKLITRRPPKYDTCIVTTTLSPSFSEFHSSAASRPSRRAYPKAYTLWIQMTPFERLQWHAIQLAVSRGSVGKVIFSLND